ncbi:MAG: terminase small subunit [Myxococcales bacterium]|nr:terminase small subunit [Myxococcales bacterium]
MSRKGKRERQKATKAPATPESQQAASKDRRCDDELTKIAETMQPRHRRFADGILEGKLGAKAAAAAGFSPASARSIAYRLLRREDVRRYIRLAQREQSVAARVTLAAVVDRLWRTVTDANATVRAKEAAMKHLVRIMVSRREPDNAAAPAGAGGELTADRIALIEAKILGVRQT